MKKMTKLFSVFATLLTVLGTLVSLAPVAHAATQETTVIVHKVVMDETAFNDFEYQEDFDKYNGNQIDDLKEYFNTQSATEVKDVRFKVWKKVEAGTTATTETKTGANLGIADDNDNYQLDPTYPNGVLTTTNGAEFTLANGTYIFVEDKENSPYYNGQKELTGMKAVPFKLELPQAKVDGTGYFNTTDALNVYPKNTEDKPEIEKTFGDNTKDTKGVNIGDDIDYKITTTVPKDAAYKTFAWEDTMVNGLDFKTGTLDISSAQVSLTDTDYSLVETKRGFTVKLTDAGLAKLETAAKAGDVNFTLTYKATLNDSAAVDTEIPNKVKLIYGNRPSDFSEPKSTKPSNGKIIVKKTWTDVAAVDVTFGVYEKETGKRVGQIVLSNGATEGELTGLDNNKDYIVIEETSVPGSLPNYSNGDLGVINVNNKKNPNPEPLEPEEPKVITYGKRFVKTDDNVDKSAAAKLVGAKFVVQKDGQFLALKDAATQATEIAAYQNAEDAYVAAVKAENPNQDDINAKKATRDAAYEAMNMQWTWVSNQSEAFTFVSSTDGKFEVKGLNAGTYQLVETKAPDGYALLTSPIEFQVGPGTWTDNSETAIDGHTRVNNKKVTIPQTGGIGTLVFTVVGLSVMVFAFIAMKKRQSEEA
ncbi:isopeptide-forming domain-containing fimbrial protein [Streptococcus suis]|uniref:Isopeptide-forming domain-containing fimbrial protein n=1 Tax=Streptococcus suis TaxID=1307 RepID=A0A9X4MR07_STRSU|nr:isopeptide-forming domain-containing fimbrial protein [Streptococcus suis]MBY5024638.1 isopeptide-forming domain-containing fimbrial protein [Streptococcus suis]MDG4525828.1 isopeptide-forming domain-containing fimbrial protein [Streptococcus suis]MDG4528214.1 isopeptide-forming domain-containing fimbrial protein [Streptococcus suis]QZT17286.1 isopeptide-forming domain-containing fimbrial protein [Streptococcus suis]